MRAPLIQESKTRPGTWFWLTEHGHHGYAPDPWLARAYARIATKKHAQETQE